MGLKVALFNAHQAEVTYVSETLRHLIRINGLELVQDAKKPDDVDVWLCSVNDPNPEQVAYMKRARRLADKGTRGQLAIAGGFEAFGGEYTLNYMDYLVVGEGFNFFRQLGKCKNTDDVRALADLPYVWTKGKPRIVPSSDIYYEELPLARTGQNSFYYLAGRGCTFKCAFCETGFAYASSHTPENMIEKALTYVEQAGGKVSFVTNDSVELHRPSKATNAVSMRVMDYVRADYVKQASFIHFGVEGWTQEQRRWFAKPIEDAVIVQLIQTLIERKQQSELFFITGQPGTLEGMHKFADMAPGHAAPYPRIFIKTTRLEPSPHTPLWNYDLDRVESISKAEFKDFFKRINAHNWAFRIFPMLSPARSTWRSAIRRAVTFEETEWFARNFPPAAMTSEEFLDQVAAQGMEHIIRWPEGRPMPGTQVITPYRELRDKMGAKRGCRPMTYWAPEEEAPINLNASAEWLKVS